ncbi:energy-coupling factor ABC transporter ATP-binding protein [Salipaludibacillus aurantiacus]|uniref:Tungstate transport system ATP-binding protein n=1 Tax=Salipaludibacillus aurantiacus TaxID=1601833 RepID=A0A1H9RSW4_9BACI|nr:ABC transporter ATP-binding protein [Salipaludibacillus aurantiacus]SER75009.1 tungstate transport system ATP-binding protein [Salipaludibacillus aurantiacus]
MTPLLEYRNIVCKKSGKTIISLDALDVQKGEIIGIMGENGAGKSTLLNALSLLELPSDGSITYKGKEVNLKKPQLHIRRQWACVFQHSYRFVGTVYDNVAIGLKLRKVSPIEQRLRVMEWLARFNLSHLSQEKAHNLSGGEAQRMNLARAFVLEPKVLFLDEPFSALDVPAKMHVLDSLRDVLTETKTTVLMISHDLTEIEFLASYFIYIYKGKVADQGHAKTVFQHPSSDLNKFLSPWKKARQNQAFTFY